MLAAAGLLQTEALNAQEVGVESSNSALRESVDRCQCLWQGSFAEVAPRSDLVIQGQVIRLRGNAADMAIERTLLGPDYHEQVRVWLQAKIIADPRRHSSQWAAGGYWHCSA